MKSVNEKLNELNENLDLVKKEIKFTKSEIAVIKAKIMEAVELGNETILSKLLVIFDAK